MEDHAMTCPWATDNADECAMTREREVAGMTNVIPDCPQHGPFPAEEPDR